MFSKHLKELYMPLVGTILCMGLPTGSYQYFRADGPFWIYPTACLSTLILFLIAQHAKKYRCFFSVASLVPLSCLGIFILLFLYLTPGSAYRVWFEMSRTTIPAGTISYFMFIKLAFFSIVSLLLWIRRRYMIASMSMLFPTLVIAAIIQQSIWLFATAFFCLTVSLFLLGGRVLTGGFRYLLTFAELLVAAACLALPFVFLDIPQPIFFDELLDTYELDSRLLRLFPGFPLVSGIPGYENPNKAARLGGRPALSSQPIFIVKGYPGETIYLRSLSYEFYSGHGWLRRIPVDEGEKYPRISSEIPPSSSETIEVEITTDLYSSVLHILGTETVFFENPPTVKEGNLRTGVITDPPLVRGTRFFISRHTAADRPENKVKEAYLQVPLFISEELSDLARSLKGETDHETIRAVLAFLSANYTYSLNAPKPAGDEVFLDNFLFDIRRGYCVHFATAFTILCRLNGVPARYVTGYLVHLPLDSPLTYVSGLQSHAWSEVLMDGGNWQTIEPTLVLNVDESDELTRQLFYSVLQGEQVETQHSPGMSDIPPGLSAGAIGVIVIVLSVIFFLRRKSRRPLLPGTIGKIVKSYTVRGVAPPEETGWRRWGWNAKQVDPHLKNEIEDLVQRLQLYLYRDGYIGTDDLAFFRKLLKLLRNSPRNINSSF